MRRLAVGLALLCAAAPAEAQQRHLEILADRFQGELERIADGFDGVLGAVVIDLESGARFGVNQTLVFPQGSAIKIVVLLELFRQRDAGGLRLEKQLRVSREDQVGGSGVVQHFAADMSALSLYDLAVLMIVLSDNAATNLLIERVGMERVNQTLTELGLGGTRLQRLMIRPSESARGNENLSTPIEAAELMARIDRCALPMERASCEQLRAILEIPKSGALPQGVRPGVPVAWKPGGITGVSTAWGLVGLPGRPYAIAVMTNYGQGGGGAAIETVSRAAFEYFARLAGATPYGTRIPLELLAPVLPDTSRTMEGGVP